MTASLPCEPRGTCSLSPSHSRGLKRPRVFLKEGCCACYEKGPEHSESRTPSRKQLCRDTEEAEQNLSVQRRGGVCRQVGLAGHRRREEGGTEAMKSQRLRPRPYQGVASTTDEGVKRSMLVSTKAMEDSRRMKTRTGCGVTCAFPENYNA